MKLRRWIDELLGCPSQCYYYFESNSGNRYCVYLRWRFSDPWTADLVMFSDDSWDWGKTSWIPITLEKEYSEDELKNLKRAAMKKVMDMFRLEGIKKKGDN